MSRTKVREIGDRPQHNRRDCGTCRTPPGHVRADEVWGRAVQAPAPYRVRVKS